MTKVFRDGKSRRSGLVKDPKKGRPTLLAAISLLGASLGVTPVQSATETRAAEGSSARDSNTKVAETVHVQSNLLKIKTNPPKTNNQLVPAVQSNLHKHLPPKKE
jgi:hypothetical protein